QARALLVESQQPGPQLADTALDARAVEDELADAVHELVEARRVDAEDDALVLAAPAGRRLSRRLLADRDWTGWHGRRTLVEGAAPPARHGLAWPPAAAERAEGGAQRGGAGGGLGRMTERHERAHPVERGVEPVEDRLAAERARPDEDEDALQRVRGLGHRRKAHHRGRALERVRLAKELVDERAPARLLLEGDERRLQRVEVLARLLAEAGEELVHLSGRDSRRRRRGERRELALERGDRSGGGRLVERGDGAAGELGATFYVGETAEAGSGGEPARRADA